MGLGVGRGVVGLGVVGLGVGRAVGSGVGPGVAVDAPVSQKK